MIDESKLLTDEEIDTVKDEVGWLEDLHKESHLTELCKAIAKAQDAETASILKGEFEEKCKECQDAFISTHEKAVAHVRAECQAKIEQTVKDDADRCATYLKAEAAECSKKIEGIFREIEGKLMILPGFKGGWIGRFIEGVWWQALKNRKGRNEQKG